MFVSRYFHQWLSKQTDAKDYTPKLLNSSKEFLWYSNNLWQPPPHVIFRSNKDTPPPWEKDVSIDVESVTSSSEPLSIPPSSTHQNHPLSTIRKGYREKTGDDGYKYDKDHYETQVGGKPWEGNTLPASLYKQGLTLLLPLWPLTYLC